MVDPIGIKPTATGESRAIALAPVERAAPVQRVSEPLRDPAPSVDSETATALSRAMAAAPPVDEERVARIKKAIEDGRFPLVPSTIADRLLALKLQWNPNDAQ